MTQIANGRLRCFLLHYQPLPGEILVFKKNTEVSSGQTKSCHRQAGNHVEDREDPEEPEEGPRKATGYHGYQPTVK